MPKTYFTLSSARKLLPSGGGGAPFLFLLLVLGGAVLETAGDILFKLWSLRDRVALLVVGLAMYIAGSVMWAFSIKYEQLSKSVFVFVIVNVLLVAAAGLMFLTNVSRCGTTLLLV